jgi:hypothetical protein
MNIEVLSADSLRASAEPPHAVTWNPVSDVVGGTRQSGVLGRPLGVRVAKARCTE